MPATGGAGGGSGRRRARGLPRAALACALAADLLALGQCARLKATVEADTGGADTGLLCSPSSDAGEVEGRGCGYTMVRIELDGMAPPALASARALRGGAPRGWAVRRSLVGPISSQEADETGSIFNGGAIFSRAAILPLEVAAGGALVAKDSLPTVLKMRGALVKYSLVRATNANNGNGASVDNDGGDGGGNQNRYD
ncbi:hypothetical protein T492DRAFT_57271 [Pavlovales sp. CCMP2436]|nr:hypothetical protein T492DRAFT_57271 [Pavlovales sp. CCMP2436]